MKKLAERARSRGVRAGQAREGTAAGRKLHFKVFVNGKKAKGFTVEFANTKSDKFKKTLHETMIEKIGAATGDAPAAVADDSKAKKKGKKTADADADADDSKAKKKGKKTADADADADEPKAKKKDDPKAKKGKDKKVADADADADDEPKAKKKDDPKAKKGKDKKVADADADADDPKAKKKGKDKKVADADADADDPKAKKKKKGETDVKVEASVDVKGDTKVDDETAAGLKGPKDVDADADAAPKKKQVADVDASVESNTRVVAHAPLEAAPMHAANRVAIRLDAGMSFANRSLKFASRSFTEGTGSPQAYSNKPVPGARLDGELYPFAFGNPHGFLAGFGFAGEYDKTLSLKLRTTQQPDTQLPATVNHFEVGVRYRIGLGSTPTSPTVTLGRWLRATQVRHRSHGARHRQLARPPRHRLQVLRSRARSADPARGTCRALRRWAGDARDVGRTDHPADRLWSGEDPRLSRDGGTRHRARQSRRASDRG